MSGFPRKTQKNKKLTQVSNTRKKKTPPALTVKEKPRITRVVKVTARELCCGFGPRTGGSGDAGEETICFK